MSFVAKAGADLQSARGRWRKKGSRENFACKIFVGKGETDFQVQSFLLARRTDKESSLDATEGFEA